RSPVAPGWVAPGFLAPDREDLVDAHPALFEGQRAAGQVQAPDPDLLFAEDVFDGGQVLFEVVQPGPDGARVVFAHRLDPDDFEPGVLDQPNRLPHRAHGHVGRDVGLDERAATRSARPAGHLLDEQPAAWPQQAVQLRAEPRVVRGADVLAHLHRRDRVIRAAGSVPVVLDPDLGAIAQAQAADALPDVAALLAGQGHGGHLGVVIAGRVHRQRTPAAAHVEQLLAGFEGELAADHLQLGALRAGQRDLGLAVGVVGAGVSHVR